MYKVMTNKDHSFRFIQGFWVVQRMTDSMWQVREYENDDCF